MQRAYHLPLRNRTSCPQVAELARNNPAGCGMKLANVVTEPLRSTIDGNAAPSVAIARNAASCLVALTSFEPVQALAHLTCTKQVLR